MKQINFFKLMGIAIVMLLFSVNAWADAWSDRGYIKTTETHKNLQILDSLSHPITKYITGTTFTFENWIYLDDMSQAKGRMFYINNGAQFGFNNDGNRLLIQNLGAGRTVDVWLDFANLPDFSVLTAGRWIHIALVVDGNNWKVYLDGTVRYNQDLAGGYINNTTNFLIGGDWWARFQGKIAEVRVWNVARTGEEILADMRKILSISTPNLVARINFGEGSGARSHNYASIAGGAWGAGGGATQIWGLVSKQPTNLQATEITSDGFTLSWDGGPETEYKIALTESNTTNTTYFTTTNKSYTFSALPAGTSYDVEVMSTMPLESVYSPAISVALISSGVANQQAAGVKLMSNDIDWQIVSENGETIFAKIYSISGSLVGEFVNQNQVKIDKSNFSKGVYIIKVSSNQGKSVFKVLK